MSIFFSHPKIKFVDVPFRSPFEIVKSIFVAVKNSGSNAKALIGNELIATLGDISYDPNYSFTKHRDLLTKYRYFRANKILNFKESFTVDWKN